MNLTSVRPQQAQSDPTFLTRWDGAGVTGKRQPINWHGAADVGTACSFGKIGPTLETTNSRHSLRLKRIGRMRTFPTFDFMPSLTQHLFACAASGAKSRASYLKSSHRRRPSMQAFALWVIGRPKLVVGGHPHPWRSDSFRRSVGLPRGTEQRLRPMPRSQ